MPLVVLLFGTGLYLAFVSRLMPLRGFGRALALLSGRVRHEGDERAEGEITYFQGLATAMSSTVGLGNISGVAIAIHQGGPGAVFWMWVGALLGMNTKFFETVVAMTHRDKDHRGQIQGGAMYAIRKLLPRRFHGLAFLFAGCGLVGTLGVYQANQLAVFMEEQYRIAPPVLGVVCAIVVAFILWGGVRRIAKTASFLAPAMCVLYTLTALVIIGIHVEKVPAVIASIFREAFTGQAGLGGAMGLAFLEVVKVGAKRGVFSNEAGLGTAPMAHGNVKTCEPIAEGLISMLGPFFDTIVVCTLTALVILTGLPADMATDTSGVLLTLAAFKTSLPTVGPHLLGLAVLLFAFTTIVGVANYNRKCWDFLWRGRGGMGHQSFVLAFCSTIIFGAVSAQNDVVNLIDIAYAMMVIPNVVVTLYAAPQTLVQLKVYTQKYEL